MNANVQYRSKGLGLFYSGNWGLNYSRMVTDIPPLRILKEVKTITQKANITFIPVDKYAFNKSPINCTAIITGAGFKTPAEAHYLNKKTRVIPVKE